MDADIKIRNSEAALRAEIVELKDQLKQAEANIARARTRDQFARSAANIGYWDFTPETGDLQWSPEVLPLMGGLAEGEIDTTYENFTKFVHPEDLDECNRIVFQAIETRQPFSIEYRVVHRDGSTHWINEWGGSVEDEGGQHRMIGAVHDITHHKAGENRLSAKIKELDFQKFALDQHAIVSTANVMGKIVYANDKFCEISGYSQEELLGQDHNLLNSKEHSPAFFTDLWKTISNGNVWVGEIRNLKKDGTYYWVKSTIVPFLDETGKPFQYVAIRTDITERKEAERELETSQQLVKDQNLQLEQRVEERTRELLISKEAAELANMTKTSFLANMSHELRTPLNAIIGFSEMMSGEFFGPLGSDKYKDYITDINESGQHLLGIISDILDISRVETGDLELNSGSFQLADAAQVCARMVAERAKAAGTSISVDVSPLIPKLNADETRLNQILLNLLSNSIKFAPDGVIKVTAELEEGGFVLCISDTGNGIAEEDLAHVLEPFGQARKGSDVTHDGVGLGLHLANMFTKLHGGRLALTSEVGVGTTVKLHFPASLFNTP